jgi:hypothetical protein
VVRGARNNPEGSSTQMRELPSQSTVPEDVVRTGRMPTMTTETAETFGPAEEGILGEGVLGGEATAGAEAGALGGLGEAAELGAMAFI